MTLFDITRSISSSTVVWAGDPQPIVERVLRMDAGDPYNETRVQFSAHTATHVDAPLHFIPGGSAIDALPLEILTGPAWVAQFPTGAQIGAAHLDAARIPPGVLRLLLKTGAPPHPTAFHPEFGALAPDGAEWCLRRGLRLVGIDTISIEGYASVYAGSVVHRALLGAGVVVVENLDLEAVAPGAYRLTCLPLKLAGSDGAPARAILESESA